MSGTLVKRRRKFDKKYAINFFKAVSEYIYFEFLAFSADFSLFLSGLEVIKLSMFNSA